VASLVLGEAAVVGIVGGVAGTTTAWLGAWGLDILARTHLPDFPFKPESYFHFSPWLLGLAVLIGVLAALLGAVVPALAASRASPAKALAG
jgi:putative ABC transport system permease protein